MAIDKDIVNNIRAEIAAVIVAQSTIFQSVYAYPRATLDGFPSVIVMPSENLADYGSTQENKHTFVFHLNVYYPSGKEADQAKTELAVGEAVGELLRIFSNHSALTTCLFIRPIPSVWGETPVGDAVYRTAQVILNCVTYPVVV